MVSSPDARHLFATLQKHLYGRFFHSFENQRKTLYPYFISVSLEKSNQRENHKIRQLH